MIGVEFMADRSKRRAFAPTSNVHRLVAAKSVEQGLMVRALPFIEVVSFFPPLCITAADCDEAIDHFAVALDAATRTWNSLPRQREPTPVRGLPKI